MIQYRKIGLGLILLIVVFGPITCQVFDGTPSLTVPAVAPQVSDLTNFYGARGVSSTNIGVYVPEDHTGEFILNLPKAGNYGIGYVTSAGMFALLVNITESALVYVGLNHGDTLEQIWADRVPDDAILPSATFLNAALPNYNAQDKMTINPVTLLVKTQVLPIAITEISYCNGEQNCVLNEMLNWVVQTPSYTWPNGGQQGSLYDLMAQTQGTTSLPATKARIVDIAAKLGYPLDAALREASKRLNSRYKTSGCCSPDAPTDTDCPPAHVWNDRTETCDFVGVEQLTYEQTHSSRCLNVGEWCANYDFKCCDGLTCKGLYCAAETAVTSCKSAGAPCTCACTDPLGNHGGAGHSASCTASTECCSGSCSLTGICY